MSFPGENAVMALRDHGSSILVSALSATFSVVLFRFASILEIASSQTTVGDHTGGGYVLSIIATAFIMIALYVGAVVTTNTFATVIADRIRTIALLRLIGSTASAQRQAVVRDGVLVGAAGGSIGAIIGLLLMLGADWALVANGILPDLPYGFARATDISPVLMVTLTTGLASWIGSRRVLTVSPMQAFRTQPELGDEVGVARNRVRRGAKLLIVIGLALLVIGAMVGLLGPFGLLIAIPGGMASFTGIVLCSHLLIPRILHWSGIAFGNSVPARLARANAIRYPDRSTRTTLGLVIGVTLVTMFAVAKQTLLGVFTGHSLNPRNTERVAASLLTVSAGLVGFSAIIAGVGLVNSLRLNVLQRTREIGLLRALGLTSKQVRRTILLESVQMVLTGTGAGLVLGTFYGWTGAQALGGAANKHRLIMLSIPWPLVAAILLGAAILAIGASVLPARRALESSPTAALSTE